MGFVGSGGGIAVRSPAADFDFSIAAVQSQSLIVPGVASTLTDRDVDLNRLTGSTYDTKYNIDISPIVDNGRQSDQIQITSLNPSVATVDGTTVSRVSNGTATIVAKTPWLQKRIDVTMSRIGGANVDTLAARRAGTLGKAMSDAVTSRATNHVVRQFSTMSHPTYVRDNGNWLADIDFSGVSAFNSYGGYTMAGVALSPRHIAYSAHYFGSAGIVLHFVTPDNTVVTRTITGAAFLSGKDFAVSVLDADLPPSIKTYKVFPASIWTSYLPTMESWPIPCVAFKQDKTVTTRQLFSRVAANIRMKPYTAADGDLYLNTAESVGGDSSSPIFALVGNEPVLLGTWSGAISCCDISQNIPEINSMMATLGGGYTVQTINLTAYQSF